MTSSEKTAVKKPLPVYSVKKSDATFTVYRDDKPLETPRNFPVAVPSQKLAQAIVEECVGQGERLDLRQMPMTQMTLTVLDITSAQREQIIAGIVRYGESELVCQRASDPADLVAEQNKVWQPYLEWCKATFNVDLRTGSGIIPFEQKPEALATLRAAIEPYDDYRLTGLSEAVGVTGSLVLGLALATGYADAATILRAAELDQLWQAKKWGVDPATEARQADIKRDLDDCVKWFGVVG